MVKERVYSWGKKMKLRNVHFFLSFFKGRERPMLGANLSCFVAACEDEGAMQSVQHTNALTPEPFRTLTLVSMHTWALLNPACRVCVFKVCHTCYTVR